MITLNQQTVLAIISSSIVAVGLFFSAIQEGIYYGLYDSYGIPPDLYDVSYAEKLLLTSAYLLPIAADFLKEASGIVVVIVVTFSAGILLKRTKYRDRAIGKIDAFLDKFEWLEKPAYLLALCLAPVMLASFVIVTFAQSIEYGETLAEDYLKEKRSYQNHEIVLVDGEVIKGLILNYDDKYTSIYSNNAVLTYPSHRILQSKISHAKPKDTGDN